MRQPNENKWIHTLRPALIKHGPIVVVRMLELGGLKVDVAERLLNALFGGP